MKILILGGINAAGLNNVRIAAAQKGVIVEVVKPEETGRIIADNQAIAIHAPPKIDFPKVVLRKTDYSFRGGSRKKGGKTKYRCNK